MFVNMDMESTIIDLQSTQIIWNGEMRLDKDDANWCTVTVVFTTEDKHNLEHAQTI